MCNDISATCLHRAPFFVTFSLFSLAFSLVLRLSHFVIFMIHDFHDFMNQVPWLCWLEKLDPVFLFIFFPFFVNYSTNY